MVAFDPLKMTGSAYGRIWTEKAFLLKMAFLPFVVNLFCQAVIMMTGQDNFFLSMSIYLLPAFFAEGWFIAHVVRLVFYDEYVAPTEKSFETQQQRRNSVKAGMLIYVLIRFLIFGAAGLFLNVVEQQGFSPEKSSPAFSFVTFFLVILFLWGFRFFWLYVPVSVGMPFKTYMNVTGKTAISFRMISTWVACFLPFSFVFSIVIGGIVAPYETLAAAPVAVRGVVAVFQAVLELFVTVLTSSAIAYGLKSLVDIHKK